jgi:RimJ/RimL family protein N-acetyltransferase
LRIVTGLDTETAAWVAARIPAMRDCPDFGPCVTLAVVDDAGMIIAGVVYNNYQPHLRGIHISVAARTSRWLTKPIISTIMNYAFRQLGCVRITAITPPGEATSVSRFLRKFGFTREGLIRKGLGDLDAVVWGLIDDDWRGHKYNVDRVDGQAVRTKSTRSRRARKRAGRRKHANGAGTAAPQHDQQHQPLRVGDVSG